MKQLIIAGVGLVALMFLGLVVGCVLSVSRRVIAALRPGNRSSAEGAGVVRAAQPAPSTGGPH